MWISEFRDLRSYFLSIMLLSGLDLLVYLGSTRERDEERKKERAEVKLPDFPLPPRDFGPKSRGRMLERWVDECIKRTGMTSIPQAQILWLTN
jgi:hypothetical protein